MKEMAKSSGGKIMQNIPMILPQMILPKQR